MTPPTFRALAALAHTEPSSQIDVRDGVMREIRALPRLRALTWTERAMDAVALLISDWLIRDDLADIGAPGAVVLSRGFSPDSVVAAGGI